MILVRLVRGVVWVHVGHVDAMQRVLAVSFAVHGSRDSGRCAYQF